MAENYNGMAVGIFELDSFAACFVALDAASAEPIAKVVSHTVIASPAHDTEPAMYMTANK